MKRKQMFFLLAVIIGLAVGAAASLATDDEAKCEKTEQNIKEEANFSGALACFPPGVIDVNLTDRVEEGSELECVCRRSSNGVVQIFAINRASP